MPIRLTAVAAMPDMGVLVWLLGPARAVPLNYLHVTPNYTRLNWYLGSGNAYASYQDLITAAMDEAGGQGFATDYAGRDLDVDSLFPPTEFYSDALVFASSLGDTAETIAELAGGFVFPQPKVLAILRRVLPLPPGEGDFVYEIPGLLKSIVSSEQIDQAAQALLVELNDSVIKPLQETREVFDGGLYLTRLYTTLSADEMTLDPAFSFNPDLADQPLTREATLDDQCDRWTLTLGNGTGREGELVISSTGPAPGFFTSVIPTIEQDSVFRTETVTVAGPPTVVTQKQFPVARLGEDNTGTGGPRLCGLGTAQCGAGSLGMLLLTMFTLANARTKRGRK